MIPAGTFEQSFVGRIMIVSDDEVLPSGWRNCDGARIAKSQWPEYFDTMGISGPTIVLPKQYQTQDGLKAVIKLRSS